MKPLNLKDKKFGRLKVLEFWGRKNARRYWKCKCVCGNETVVDTTHLRRGHTKSCGCLNRELQKRRAKEKQLPKGVASLNTLYTCYKILAEKRNLEFSINRQLFEKLVLSDCFYCGQKPNQKGVRKDILHNGVDRINNKQGYILSNCVPCCAFCNGAKSNKTKKEFLSWVEKVHKYQSGKTI